MKFGLIGHPIEHSLSPALFKAGYDGRYPYELIQTDDFEEAYARFLKEYDGINVTAPFKELAIRKADILSEECQAIGATNLLVKTPEGIKAYNSDYLGVRLWIEKISRLASLARNDREEDGRNDRMTRVLIVGLGGAGKAAKAAAESLGFDTSIINRTQYTPEIKPLKDFRQEFLKADIIIYNLPVRINEIDELTQDDLSYCGRKVILEANYRNPSFDKELIAKLKEHHHMLEYTGGETWLLLQALTGYEIFTGEKPDLEKMTACL
jgi:shikimate dehydrogenase